MASGPVGQRAIAFLNREYPDDLAAVVLESDAAWGVFEAADCRLARACRRLVWRDVEGQPSLLGDLGLDVLLLAWWPFIIRQNLIDTARRTLNFHPSLLPYGRGKDPNFWAIADGTPFGVTIHHVERGVDAGAIAFQRQLPYAFDDTGETLYLRALSAMNDLFVESYPSIRLGDIPAIPQGGAEIATHRRADLTPATTLSPGSVMSVRDLLNLLRAKTYPPHPGCRIVEHGRTYDVTVVIKDVT